MEDVKENTSYETDSNYQMIVDYQNGNELAMEKLIFSNMGFIKKMADNYYRTISDNKIYEFEDVINSCVVGFIEAAKKYDITKKHKTKFSTFAFYYMRMEILNEIYGTTKKERCNNLLNRNATSIYAPVKGTDESLTIEDTIEDNAAKYCFDDVNERLYLQQLREEVRRALRDNLTLQEEEIIRLRYGFEGKEMTLGEIADMIETELSKVRKIENRSMRKLRTSTFGRKYIQEVIKSKGMCYSYNFSNMKMDIERSIAKETAVMKEG